MSHQSRFRIPTFLDFPVEIIEHIFSYVPVSPPPTGVYGFSSLCLVNRRFNAIATPILYNSITLEYSLVSGFLARSIRGLLQPNHRGVKLIRHLKIQENTKLITLGQDDIPFKARSSVVAHAKELMALMLNILFREIGEDQLLSISCVPVSNKKLYWVF
ncbi:hypothetical protein ABW19_dt0205670 [Dactylella cylindrospora]|nr:hypothetical protein ABW19_dt0205670 [Dactylella cylindrospora]